MKIGIDIRLIGKKRTGDEVVIFNLVKNLAKLATEHTFFLFTDATDEKTLAEIAQQLELENKPNFQIISLQTANRFAWNFWTLPQYLKKNPVDVYHTQYITPFFVSKKIKIVTIIHDISFNFFPQHIKWQDLFFLKTLIPLSIKRADMVVGVSKFTMDEIAAFYKTPQEKLTWIHNAIADNFATSSFTEAELEAVRQKYALPKEFLLYMGTLQPRKNIPHLIEAFARIKDRLPEINLVICGKQGGHNYDQNIEKTLESWPLAGRIFFPGFVAEEDKAAIFHLAKVFVYPSLYEGFGIPILEAMSQQVPVLCSDIPSLKEVAQDSVLYFDPKSIDDLVEKMYIICTESELQAKLIQAGKNRISFFSWQNSAQKMLAIYEKLEHN